MGLVATLTDFSPSTTIRSSEVDANFAGIRDVVNTYCVLTDVARTITVTHTWSASQTFSGGITGTTAAMTGNCTVGGTLGVTGVLTATGGVTGNVTGNLTGNVTGNVTGNASTATALQTARTINGTSFDGTANITVTAAAGTLTGTTLNATVTGSSLTSLGTLAANLLFVDATHDIGAAGATRPRDLYLSRKALIGGEIEIDGALNHDGVQVGFFGTAPANQPTLTGALNSVSDSNAADVLNSICAALSQLGLAADNTT